MQSLYNSDIYPDQVREMILHSGQLGIGNCQESCRVTSSSLLSRIWLNPFRIEPDFILQRPVPCRP